MLGAFGRLRWRTRLTLWAAAGCAGLVTAGFAELTDYMQGWFVVLHEGRAWVPFLLTPAIGAVVVWATTKHFPGSQGSGIPQVIAAARLVAHRQPVTRLVSMRIAIGKVFLGVLALFGGFSAGREGPSVQVASSLLYTAQRLLPRRLALRDADLILAGGAAGIAAAFNTPLAGIVFAIEELSRRVEARTSGILISSVILAGLTAIAVEGNYVYFGTIRVGTVTTSILPALLLSALVCGVLGGIFSRLLLLPQLFENSRFWRWRAAYPVRFAALCGLIVAFLGWATGGATFGSGYAITSSAMAGTTTLHWAEPFAKFVATVVSYFSGIPGGIFAPCLAVGAGVGFDIAHLIGATSAHPIVALCMASFLAAVTQSPITSTIIVMEMIDNQGMVMSLMAATLIAKAISSRFGPELYHHMALGFARQKPQS